MSGLLSCLFAVCSAQAGDLAVNTRDIPSSDDEDLSEDTVSVGAASDTSSLDLSPTDSRQSKLNEVRRGESW